MFVHARWFLRRDVLPIHGKHSYHVHVSFKRKRHRFHQSNFYGNDCAIFFARKTYHAIFHNRFRHSNIWRGTRKFQRKSAVRVQSER